VKLFSDENLSPQHAFELRTEGHDAIAVLEAGLSGFPPERTLGVVRLKVHPGSWS
jgi:hypothetical protein